MANLNQCNRMLKFNIILSVVILRFLSYLKLTCGYEEAVVVQRTAMAFKFIKLASHLPTAHAILMQVLSCRRLFQHLGIADGLLTYYMHLHSLNHSLAFRVRGITYSAMGRQVGLSDPGLTTDSGSQPYSSVQITRAKTYAPRYSHFPNKILAVRLVHPLQMHGTVNEHRKAQSQETFDHGISINICYT
jgi:hypothetical protein